jgi:ElaB/YqjD/DUF883 family membrane-anchored ribosome-binding protein
MMDASDSTAAAKADIDTLKADVKALRDDLANLARRAGNDAAEKAKRKLKEAGDVADDAVKNASEYREMLEERVREHPLAAVGIALAAGMVLTSLGRRR